jgi:thiol-disulfide isomerase/thioredoxin
MYAKKVIRFVNQAVETIDLAGRKVTTSVADGVTVIDFWADWGGPCRAMAPQLERAAARRPQHRFVKVDVDNEPPRASAAEAVR